jgi:integrase
VGRKASGSAYESDGSFYVAVSLQRRTHFILPTCRSKQEAEVRRHVLAEIASKLKRVGRLDAAETLCRQAAAADGADLSDVLRLVDGFVRGHEHLAQPTATPTSAATSTLTVRAFGELWTSNELARRHPGRVREIDHEENIRKLEKHVYPVRYNGRRIADVPLDEFTIDVADHVLAQPSLPRGSVRHVAQCMLRLVNLAVYPARVLKASPFPARGWLPKVNRIKERAYLFPHEEQALLACTDVPLVWRLFLGFCAREGLRRENAVTLQWSNVTLDLPGGGAHIDLDTTKNGRGGNWPLDPGTAGALRRWKALCPSERWVFPCEALPRYRRRRAGLPLSAGHAGEKLREALLLAGQERPKLFQRDVNRIPIRAHDLRATFVTLALANGKTEDWVMRRTGHSSSIMLARYRRDAETLREHNLGWLADLAESIPEFRKANDESASSEVQLSG